MSGPGGRGPRVARQRPPSAEGLLRRARPALGTLVEVGVRQQAAERGRGAPAAVAAIEAAFRALGVVERALSVFDPQSDVGRFNRAAAGATLAIERDTEVVLLAAAAVSEESGGLFDVTQGTGARDWSLPAEGRLRKHTAAVRLDLGGIGKGHAVDRAFDTLREALDGPRPAESGGTPCWVNAGGDLRVFGVALSIHLRDEERGGARPWLLLRDGALATSYFGRGARARLAGGSAASARHVSVAGPRCLACDALTKVVALSGRAEPALLARHQATAWLHR